MAFTATVQQRTVYGGHEVVIGKYVSSGGSEGGDIATGLHQIHACFLQPWGSAVVANQPAVNETMPLASGTVTIVTAANESGSFIIIGN